MKNTTLVYIEKDNKYLMLLRNKKKNDLNEGKWIGVGGKFEENETPEECMAREVMEETGLTVLDYKLNAVVTFLSDTWEGEYMYLFTVTDFAGELVDCDEGELRWIPKEEILDLNLWEGDRHFLELMAKDSPFFTMKLRYEGDKLVEMNHKIY